MLAGDRGAFPSRRVVIPGLALLLVGGLAWPRKAAAQNASAAQVFLFNIPVQPLESALFAFSTIVNAQVIYNAQLARGRVSRAVIGLFAADTALRMMIEGTDLAIRHTSPHAVALVSTGERMESPGGEEGGGGSLELDTLYLELPPGARQKPDFGQYSQRTREEIKRALSRNSATAYRTGTLQIQIWIDGRGHVREARLVRASASRQFDSSVEQVLRAVAVGAPPPPGMPQPIKVTIIGF